MKTLQIPTILLGFILFIANNVFFTSCESTDDPIPINSVVYDTIKPKDYFPVYPGSWWKYKINDTSSIIDSTCNVYKQNSYVISRDWDDVPTYSDTLYVPFLNGCPIYGYYKVEYIAPPFGDYYKKWPILSETIGYEFDRGWTDYRHGDQNEHVKVVQKILRNNDSIIILKGHWVPNDFNMEGGNLNNISIQEYKKYVGLTNYYLIDTTINDTIYKKVLIDYFINK